MDSKAKRILTLFLTFFKIRISITTERHHDILPKTPSRK